MHIKCMRCRGQNQPGVGFTCTPCRKSSAPCLMFGLLFHRECSEVPWWHLSPLSSALEDLPQHNQPDEVLQPGSAQAATMLQSHLSAAVEPEVGHSVQLPMQSSASEQTAPSEPPKKKGETQRRSLACSAMLGNSGEDGGDEAPKLLTCVIFEGIACEIGRYLVAGPPTVVHVLAARRARILKDGQLTMIVYGADEALKWQLRISKFFGAVRSALWHVLHFTKVLLD